MSSNYTPPFPPGTYRSLADGQLMLLHQLRQQEAQGITPGIWREDLEQCTELVKKIRQTLEKHALDMDFTTYAMVAAAHVYCRSLEDLTVLMIDCYDRLKGRTIMLHDLDRLYPNGFYDDETVSHYIEKWIMSKSVPCSDFYSTICPHSDRNSS